MEHAWIAQLTEAPQTEALASALQPGRRVVAEGAWGSSPHLLAGALAVRTRRPVLLVVAHLDDSDEAAEDLALFDGLEVVQFPALEVMPGESNVSLELLAERLAVVSRLIEDRQPAVLIAPIQALMQSVPERDALGAMAFEVRVGQELSQEALIQWLADTGYSRVDAVEQPGDFAVRGGIVDVYPPGQLPPARIDFFGDEVDTVSEIDLDSMGSNRKLEQVQLIGASAERIQSNENTTSLWTFLDRHTIVLLHELIEVGEQARGYYERLTNGRGIYSPQATFKALQQFAYTECNQFGGAGTAQDVHVPMPVRGLVNFEKDAEEAIAQLAELAMGDSDEPVETVVVICQKPAERDRLLELIHQHAPEAADRIQIEIGYLYRGFLWHPDEEESRGALALIPHHELFHRYTTRRRLRRLQAGRAIDTFLDLNVGDYVVHTHHGIAQFKGLRLMKREGEAEQEYLTLEFADRALLHVPASHIELIQKYIGGFSGRPPLSKLGGTRWKKQKEQVKEAVKDLAAQLLRVQAARASMPGIRFPADTPWMKQFEAEFPYQETDDQLAAMVEIKKNMSDEQPMDRLICGDVGYGKTELAMRAAFKAVESGKQVAVLCPTTVLCEQHERTFRQRIADYPFKIESLSRFKSPQEARQIVQALRQGKVDIVIGTHRLLSEDVQFKDLGMVIVDEEQKFGVEHKQKLMRFRFTVDVLTLSATPIPRTLHMALLGLRDISSLSTPPADRRAVVTEVVPYDLKRIRTAILRELNRDGQCFFVHNRVHDIHSVANTLRSLVPEARFVVGHGQMKPKELEEVMLKFLRHKVDVLVSTTIIESGIDIPIANTMFINDADRFGLAEMHQLRGRVGRYKHRAYCYLLLPQHRPLSEVASRRLRAIEEYAMLGAGFKIAMRDMEIRGVGNILGPEQSGHIATVGYEMYCRLLEQATSELKRETLRIPVETHLELNIAGHVPQTYIPSAKHRMDAYRRLSRAHDLETLREVEQDLVEAYGPLPRPAQTLVALSEIRTALSHLDVESLKLHEKDLIFTTRHVQRLYKLLEHAPGSVRLVDNPTATKPGTVFFRPPANYLEGDTLLAVLRKLVVRPVDQQTQNTAATAPAAAS